MNKKGTDKMLSLYWFAILTIVAGGIFVMVYIFYGAPYDVRKIESQLFANKIVDCISQGGRINAVFLSNQVFNSEIQENLLEECTLNFNVEEEYGVSTPQYFLEIEFYTLDDLSEPAFKLNEGNLNWEKSCFIKNKKAEDYNRFPKCAERRFYALDEENNQYLIKVLSAVGKFEKNVKQ
ncbi:MAG: hypothetical protein ABIE36_02725 [Candidatus Diapherotrites archaeon]